MNKHLKNWAAAGLMALFMGTAAAAPQVLFQKSSIVASAEEYGDYIYQVESDNSVTITKYKGTAKTVTVPKKINGKNVKKIAGAFQNNKELKKVTLQSGITVIDNFSFAKCPELYSVTLPNTLKSINWNAFSETPSLTGISLPTSLETVGSSAFRESGLTSITFGANVTIGSGALAYCKKLTSVTLPSNMTEISDGLFSGSGISTVTIPSGVTKLGKNAFSYSNIASITLPAKLTEIGDNAFIKTKLTSITFPSTLTIIGKSAFQDLPISSVTIPGTVTTIGDYAFSGTKISSITLPSSVSSIGGSAFAKCANLSTVKIKGTVTMGAGVFSESDKVTNIDMNSATWEKALTGPQLSRCNNLSTINGVKLVQYRSSGEPFIPSKYLSAVKKNFANIDQQGNIAFFEKYLTEMIAYVARTQTAGCTTDAQKVKKLHDWVVNKVDYAYVGEGKNRKPDPSVECHVDSSVFMRDTTVCEGYARALTLLLKKANIEAHYVSGTGNSGGHAWVIVKLGSYYFHVDPTWDDGSSNYKYFLKSDKEYEARNHHNWGVVTYHSFYTSRLSEPQGFTTPKCLYSIGDINKDGLVNGADKKLLLQHLARIKSILSADRVLADVNCDGTIDVSDAVQLNVSYGTMGDANRDGKVDNSDVTRISLAVRGKVTLSLFETALADVNYDGKVTLEDAAIISGAILNDEVYLL